MFLYPDKLPPSSPPVEGEIREYTNTRGKKIKIKFVRLMTLNLGQQFRYGNSWCKMSTANPQYFYDFVSPTRYILRSTITNADKIVAIKYTL